MRTGGALQGREQAPYRRAVLGLRRAVAVTHLRFAINPPQTGTAGEANNAATTKRGVPFRNCLLWKTRSKEFRVPRPQTAIPVINLVATVHEAISNRGATQSGWKPGTVSISLMPSRRCLGRGLSATVSATPPKRAPGHGLPAPILNANASGTVTGRTRSYQQYHGTSITFGDRFALTSQITYTWECRRSCASRPAIREFQDGTVAFPHRSTGHRNVVLYLCNIEGGGQPGTPRLKTAPPFHPPGTVVARPADPHPHPAPKPGSRSTPHHTRCRRTGGTRPPSIRHPLVQGERMNTPVFPNPAAGLSARGRRHASRTHRSETARHAPFVIDTRSPL